MEDAKTRINASFLSSYQGKGVVLLGKVKQVESSGTSLSLESSDGKTVTVTFDSPVMENIEGIIEVHGTCHGSQIKCQSYYMLPIDTVENFDMEAYDEAVKIIHSTENPWIES